MTPPLTPEMKADKRARNSQTIAAAITWTATAALFFGPWIAWTFHPEWIDALVYLGIAATIGSLFMGVFAGTFTSAAFMYHDRYRRALDRREWDNYQREQAELKRLLKDYDK